jgi:hypothetical protein
MPIGTCPNCDKGIDLDGFWEHGVETLFYCECGRVLNLGEEAFSLIEVPNEEVDLTNVPNWPIPEDHYVTEQMSRGLFIKKSRWKKK